MIFRHADYFIAIVETGSLSKAAEKLWVSQPSLSQYLKKLEKEVGVELFDHSTSPLRLTYAGERYYESALKMRRLDENTKKELHDIENETSGRIRLGIPFWRSACLLPEIFPYFYEKYPNIQLELSEGRAKVVVERLMNDEIDLAVVNQTQLADHSKLRCQTIFAEHILLAVPTQHPEVQKVLANQPLELRKYPLCTLDLVKKLPLLSTKPGQALTVAVNYALQKNNITPNIILEIANLTAAINIIARGVGCAFVPEEGAKVCTHPGLVTFMEIDSPDFIWPLTVIYRRDAYLSKICQLFITTLKEKLTDQATF